MCLFGTRVPLKWFRTSARGNRSGLPFAQIRKIDRTGDVVLNAILGYRDLLKVIAGAGQIRRYMGKIATNVKITAIYGKLLLACI